MGYFSDLDIRIKESTGNDWRDIEIPFCQICGNEQGILDIVGDGKYVLIHCTSLDCLNFDKHFWINTVSKIREVFKIKKYPPLERGKRSLQFVRTEARKHLKHIS
jgi:hypothetical protein